MSQIDGILLYQQKSNHTLFFENMNYRWIKGNNYYDIINQRKAPSDISRRGQV